MYYIVFGILYLLSLLPLAFLYLLSSFLYVLTYYIIGYRKKMVFKNLAVAFPGKTYEERKQLAKQFYRHFWDNWVEAIKLMSISAGTVRRRVSSDLAALETVYA